MDIRAARVGSAVILRLEGRMTAEAGSDWVRAAVEAATADGARHVVCDLRGIGQLDCTGIGQLLNLRERIHGARRTFALSCVERRQRRMLELSGLLHVFRMFADSRTAVVTLGLCDALLADAAIEGAPMALEYAS
jgi:anti-anti-sigma factor